MSYLSKDTYLKY